MNIRVMKVLIHSLFLKRQHLAIAAAGENHTMTSHLPNPGGFKEASVSGKNTNTGDMFPEEPQEIAVS